MDDTFVTTVYVILADMERALQLPIKYKPKMTLAEILTVRWWLPNTSITIRKWLGAMQSRRNSRKMYSKGAGNV